MTPSPSPLQFSDRLVAAVLKKRSHIVVGLDPHPELIPVSLRSDSYVGDPESICQVIARFSIGVLDAIADLVPAVKPQVAFFERFGAAGFAALQVVVRAAKDRGLLVISDAKRGDISSTASAYAEFHMGCFTDSKGREHRLLDADAVTVNAYLGRDSLTPWLRFLEQGKGIFVLAKTSNPGSGDLQDRTVISPKGEKPLYEAVADIADDLAPSIGRHGFRPVGLVVGATFPEQASQLRERYPHLYFLVPGYGAQGAGADDVARCFNEAGLGALVNASRSILFASRERRYAGFGETAWQEACRAAARDMIDEINAVLSRTQRTPW